MCGGGTMEKVYNNGGGQGCKVSIGEYGWVGGVEV
jgi:hypothetical protein